MCNPRKVMVHLNRCIEEAWQRTVEESATAEGAVAELARITAAIPLAEEMGDAALAMLERVLSGEFAGFEPWTRDDRGRFRRDLDTVTLVYDPATRELTVEAQLTERVTAEARGAAEACGFTVGEVAVEAVGHYYHDGWGGRTRERAEEEARAAAELRLAEAVEALHAGQHAAELEAASARAREDAGRRAAEALAERQREVRAALRTQLQAVLSDAQEQVAHVMHRASGEAYRQTLRQLVLDTGGRVLRDERTGSVINMELEIY